jgi:DNA (cytosine-5)-methyltransferase 1
MPNKINVIDLFAGPGGLGEGFAGFRPGKGVASPFKIRMSVENEPSAHQTLTLRALYRSLTSKRQKSIYHDYIAGDITFEELKTKLPAEFAQAKAETLGKPAALGDDNEQIHKQLREMLTSSPGEPWIVIGGPPCQAYSLVGRSRNQGKKGYRAESDNRHYLYKEYLKVLNTVQPDAFIMENVRGILTSKINGQRIFPSILEDLEDPAKVLPGLRRQNRRKYKIYSFVLPPDQEDLLSAYYANSNDFVIKSENFGIPQTRHRVILLGVAADINKEPTQLIPQNEVKIEHVLTGLPDLRSKLSKGSDSPEAWAQAIQTNIKPGLKELKQSGLKELSHFISANAEKLKAKAPTHSHHNPSNRPIIGRRCPDELAKWLRQDPPKSILNHRTRGHMADDLARYLFCSSWAHIYRDSVKPLPKASDFPSSLTPKHANWHSGHFADRFRVQGKGRPSTTITSHISKDGHYFIHYDPTQCRSLTVREAARLQTFPDNYLFEGNQTQQYVQVGNAVPPFLAKQLAGIVYKLLKH